MLTLVQEGGPVMWILVVVAVFSAVVFLERLLHLHRAQIDSEDFFKGIRNILKRGNIVEALSICEETPGPCARIVRVAILHHDEQRNDIIASVEEAGLTEIPRLERNMNLLATVAQIAPLLGLLGTVLGLMQILMAMAADAPLIYSGDLVAGLRVALLTTAAGLAVAIPVYVAYNLLVSRVETILLDMEWTTIEITAFLSSKNRKKN